MRWFAKCCLAVLVIAGLAPFILPGADGRRLLQWGDLQWSALTWPDWTDLGEDTLPDVVPESHEPRTYYKWRDETGTWHYGDAPPEGVQAQPVEVRPDANVMPAPDGAPRRAAAEDAASAGDGADINGPLERAREAASRSEQRSRRLDEAIRADSGGK